MLLVVVYSHVCPVWVCLRVIIMCDVCHCSTAMGLLRGPFDLEAMREAAGEVAGLRRHIMEGGRSGVAVLRAALFIVEYTPWAQALGCTVEELVTRER